MLLNKNRFQMNRTWTNRDLNIIRKYKEKLHQVQQQQIKQKILNRQSNTIDFYTITPKEQLPKFLQKYKFQTIHLKQKELTKTIKIFKNQMKRPQQQQIRMKLKSKNNFKNNNHNQIMLLSQIYQHLQEGNDKYYAQQQISNKFTVGDLQYWEQKRVQKENQQLPKQLLYLSNRRIPGQRRSGNQLAVVVSDPERQSSLSNNMEKYNVKKFRDGANYKAQMEKSLQIIQMSHSQNNIMNKFVFIQNSSKVLKQQLDEKKAEIQKSIKNKEQMLQKKLEQHHQIFQQRARLLNEQRKSQDTKDEISSKHTNSLSFFPKLDNKSALNQQKAQQRTQKLAAIQSKVIYVKKNIQQYQNDIVKLNEDLKNIRQADEAYFKISLRNGIDCRQTGLGWIIKKLKQMNFSLNNIAFPLYLDKKSKAYIVKKVQLQSALQELMEIKRQFVNEIGRQNSAISASKARVSVADVISQQLQFKKAPKSGCFDNQPPGLSSNVPLRYRKSIKKLSILEKQYNSNHHLFELRQRKGLAISSGLDGLTGKQIYEKTAQRIKKINFNKMKKEKNNGKNGKLIQYQNILQKIKDMHIQIEQLDIQHENHLLSNYYDQRDIFFMQTAACFGSKKAYSMIIKNFSVKNAFGN